MAKSHENRRETLFTREKCSNCELKPALVLNNVWHKGRYLRICTACVLNLHQGAFCPICFEVYDKQNSPPKDCVKCSGCKAVCHFTCIPALHSTMSGLHAAFAASSSSSFSTSSQAWVCQLCSDPGFKFFKFSRDERSKGVKIDSYLASQMLAAATISRRTTQQAVTLTRIRAQILSKEATQAKKEAKEALRELHELTLEPQEKDSDSDTEYVPDDVSDHNDDDALDDETENALQDEQDNESMDAFEYESQDGSSEFQYAYNSEEPSENEPENEAWDDDYEYQSVEESEDESDHNTSESKGDSN